MYKAGIYTMIVMLMVGCKEKPGTTTEPQEDSLSVVQKIVAEDSMTLSTAGVQDWVNTTLKSSRPVNNLHLEEYWRDDSLLVMPASTEPSFYSDYHQVLRWSPDSTYIMDIGSYGYIPVKDARGNVRLEAGEPDNELALIEPKQQKRTRLMFVGPSSDILDAKWINNRQALVIGTFDKTGNDNYDTLVWLIDVKDKFFRLYNVKKQ